MAVIATADRAGVYAEDGHVSVRGWTKATVRLSNAEVTHRIRTGAPRHRPPECGVALAAGALGVAQVRELARLHANPRCGDQLPIVVDTLLEFATTAAIRDVLSHHPALGTARRRRRRTPRPRPDHDARQALVTEADGTLHLSARFGAAQGAQIAEVFEAFVGPSSMPTGPTHAGPARRRCLPRRVGPQRTPTPRRCAGSDLRRCRRQQRQSGAAGGEHRRRPAGVRSTTARHGRPIEPVRFESTTDPLPVPNHPRRTDRSGRRRRRRSHRLRARVVIGADGVITDLGGRAGLFTGGAHRPRCCRPPRRRWPLPLARLHQPALPGRPHAGVDRRRWRHRHRQQRTTVPAPQPLEDPRLSNVA